MVKITRTIVTLESNKWSLDHPINLIKGHHQRKWLKEKPLLFLLEFFDNTSHEIYFILQLLRSFNNQLIAKECYKHSLNLTFFILTALDPGHYIGFYDDPEVDKFVANNWYYG